MLLPSIFQFVAMVQFVFLLYYIVTLMCLQCIGCDSLQRRGCILILFIIEYNLDPYIHFSYWFDEKTCITLRLFDNVCLITLLLFFKLLYILVKLMCGRILVLFIINNVTLLWFILRYQYPDIIVKIMPCSVD